MEEAEVQSLPCLTLVSVSLEDFIYILIISGEDYELVTYIYNYFHSCHFEPGNLEQEPCILVQAYTQHHKHGRTCVTDDLTWFRSLTHDTAKKYKYKNDGPKGYSVVG